MKKQNPFVNVFKIFLEDQRHLFRNVIGIVVAMGLVIVPSMYAWFNIAANWDPYGSTNQLKVAVANEDQGYKSDLISIPVNVGNNIEAALRKNNGLDWQFVSKDKAVDGVNSGKYYAAIVIPKNFSSQMMTLFSSNTKQAKIEYYINEKSNAIAPKITEKAADTVVSQISSTFSKTLASVALDLADNVSSFTTSTQGQAYINTAVKRLNSGADDLDLAGTQLATYASLLNASSALVNSSQEVISSGVTGSQDVREALNNTVSNVKSLADATSSSTSSVSQALDSATSSLDSIASQLDSLTSSVSSPTGDISTRLNQLGSAVTNSASQYQLLITALTNVKNQVNASTVLSDTEKARMTSALDSSIAQLNQAASDVATVGTHISSASSDVTTAKNTINTQKADLKKQIDSAKNTLAQVKASYNSDIKPQLTKLASQLNTTVSQARNAISSVRAILTDLESNGQKAQTTISETTTAMTDAQTSLSSSATSLRDLATKLKNGVDTTDAQLSKITGNNRSAVALAAMLSAPVKLKRNAVFAIKNYGSAMAGFYTILAIWVGSVFLVAMMKTAISDREKAKVLGLASEEELYEHVPRRSGPHLSGNASKFGLGLGSEYWGRYLTFLLISLLQSTLLIMGDLWYLKIQCKNPLQLFLVGWCASLVFSTLMYALTVGFGAVGKAIAVVLMVMQIAGSGGTFPIELLPKFFQWVYPLLPFPYGLRAMHAAIAGSYGNEYWVALGQFLLFMLPALLIGLVIARPFSRSNWFVDQVKKTHVYGES